MAVKDDPSVAQAMEATLPDLYVYIAGYFSRPVQAVDGCDEPRQYLRIFYPEHPKTLAFFEGAPGDRGWPWYAGKNLLQNLVES